MVKEKEKSLADICIGSKDFFDPFYPNPHDGRKALKRILNEAEKFNISKSAYDKTAEVVGKSMKTVKELARLPFPDTWFEFETEAGTCGILASEATDRVEDEDGKPGESTPLIEVVGVFHSKVKGNPNFGKHTVLRTRAEIRNGEVEFAHAEGVEGKEIEIGEQVVGGYAKMLMGFCAILGSHKVAVVEDRKPEGKHFAAGKLRPFFAYRMVTIDLGADSITRRMRTAAHKNRRHTVRGYWTFRYKRFDDPPSDLENWAWGQNLKGRFGWKRWVANHERGDASLGWVYHRYQVEHRA